MKIKTRDYFARRMFDLKADAPNIRCPFNYEAGRRCEGVPHMYATVFGRDVPPDSVSGPGLIVMFACEWGHRWQLRLADHSAGTWITVEEETT